MGEPYRGLSGRRVAMIVGLAALFVCVSFLILRGAVVVGVAMLCVGLFAAWLTNRLDTTRTNQKVPATGAPAREIVTEFLDVRVDDTTNLMRGLVRKGLFVEQLIEELRPAELALLWQDCRANDPASSALVEAHLDTVYPRWREDVRRGEEELSSGPGGRMSVAEAYKILGLRPGANREQIRHAHRDLMLKLHPDRGGSTYLSSKINEAKDVLLAHDDRSRDARGSD